MFRDSEEVVSHLKTFTYKGFKFAAKKKVLFSGLFRLSLSLIIKSILQGSGGYTTRIRRLYNKDQEVISRIFLV